MTTLDVTLDLPDRLAREALTAGVLTPKALRQMVKDATQQRAAPILLAAAEKATLAGSKPLPVQALQAEVNTVRKTRGSTSA